MRDLEIRLRKGDRSENWTGRLLWGEAGQEIMHPLADLGRRGGNEVTPQGFPLITEGATKSHPRLSAGHEEHLQMKGFPRRRGEGGWVLREISRSLSVVFVVGWRGPSVVVVDGRDCCGDLDAS